jgi:capsular polysaccharide biosynthesis protein
MVDAPYQVAPIAVETEGPLASSSVKEGLSLSDIGAILLKWKWLILACLLIAVLLGYVYSKTRVPLYEGTATIDLNPSQTNMGLSDLIQESLSAEDVRLPTEVARLQSNLVIFDTIKELAQQDRGPFPNAFNHLPPNAGMEAFPPGQLQRMIGSVRGALKVTVVTGTDIVAISYRDPRPQVAKDVPNKIVEVYLKRNLDDHMEGTGRVTRWLATEMEGLKQQATQAQARLAQYQKEHNLIEIGGGGSGPGQNSGGQTAKFHAGDTAGRTAEPDCAIYAIDDAVRAELSAGAGTTQPDPERAGPDQYRDAQCAAAYSGRVQHVHADAGPDANSARQADAGGLQAERERGAICVAAPGCGVQPAAL